MGSRNNKPGRIVKGTALQPSLKSASGVWSLDEAMQAHRANAWPQPNLFQPISNSLRVKQQGGSTSAGVLSKSIVREGDIKEIINSVVYRYIDDPNENPEDCESVRFIDETETIKFFKSSVCRYFYLMKWENEEWFYIDKIQNLEWRKF